MHNVFSNYLKWSWLGKKAKTSSVKAALDEMAKTYNTDEFHAYYNVEIDPHIIVSSPLTLNEYNQPGTYTHECFNNDDLRSVIKWINKNILLRLTHDSYITIGVRIRIATCMINKLVGQEKLKKDYGILAHDILVANVTEIQNTLLNESLPF